MANIVTPETIAKALSEYLKIHYDQTILRIDWSVDVEMTDHAEPTPIGKFTGATVVFC